MRGPPLWAEAAPGLHPESVAFLSAQRRYCLTPLRDAAANPRRSATARSGGDATPARPHTSREHNSATRSGGDASARRGWPHDEASASASARVGGSSAPPGAPDVRAALARVSLTDEALRELRLEPVAARLKRWMRWRPRSGGSRARWANSRRVWGGYTRAASTSAARC